MRKLKLSEMDSASTEHKPARRHLTGETDCVSGTETLTSRFHSSTAKLLRLANGGVYVGLYFGDTPFEVRFWSPDAAATGLARANAFMKDPVPLWEEYLNGLNAWAVQDARLNHPGYGVPEGV